MDIIPSNNGTTSSARGALWTSNGRLLIENSGSSGGINVRAIQTGANLGSTVFCDNGMLMTESVSIPSDHWEIHKGSNFYYTSTNAAVPDASIVSVSINPTGETCHIMLGIAAEGKLRFSLIEATGTNGGANVTPQNSNRASSHLSESILKTGATPMAGGTVLQTGTLFGGTGPNSIGSSIASRNEWMFATGKHYVLQARNAAGQAKDIDFSLSWYESGPDYHSAGWPQT